MAYLPVERTIRENPLLAKCLVFSVEAVQYATSLDQERRFAIANQFLRAATSIGANAMESQSAESKADFIHKLKIADKEAHETYYWLTVCKESPDYPDTTQPFSLLTEILRILSSIIRSSKNPGSRTSPPPNDPPSF